MLALPWTLAATSPPVYLRAYLRVPLYLLWLRVTVR